MRTTNAELYGRSVFTTVAIAGAEPFLWDKHVSRLRAHARVTGLDLSDLDAGDLYDRLKLEIAASGELDARARITIFDDAVAARWGAGNGQKATVEIMIAPREPAVVASLGLSPFPVNSLSPIAGIKSGNYLEQLLSLEDASKGGFDEAVRINQDGIVVSACMANLFWAIDGRLCTPDLRTGCLAGTTREYVLEKLDCREVTSSLDELEVADAIYLTSAGLGIAKVNSFLGRELSSCPALDTLRLSAGL